jgi:hypothetical protein
MTKYMTGYRIASMNSYRKASQSQVRPKVLRRFYEPLLLLNALDQMRGARIKPDVSDENLGPNQRKIRRSLVDGLAYICAFKKHPDYVTAVALERTPQEVVIWLAANADIKPQVVGFLESVVRDLCSIARNGTASQRHQTGLSVETVLLPRIIDFNKSRIQTYFKLAQTYAFVCLPIICSARESSGKCYLLKLVVVSRHRSDNEY